MTRFAWATALLLEFFIFNEYVDQIDKDWVLLVINFLFFPES